MESRKRPKVVYRLYSYERSVQTLLSGSFRWSSPFSFNDPFDCQWHFAWQVDCAAAIEYEASLLRQFFECPIAKFNLFGGQRLQPAVYSTLKAEHDQFRQRDSLKKQSYLMSLIPRTQRLRKLAAENASETLKRKMRELRILCASENPGSVLLWSHYADQHRGVAFEIDTEKLIEPEPHHYFEPVRYVEELPPVFTRESVNRCGVCGEPLVHLPEMKLTTQYVCVKEKFWAYETEWRAIAMAGPNAPGDPLFTPVEIKPGTITRIVLGTRFLSTHGDLGLKSLQNAAKALPGPIPQIVIAKADERAFKINIPGRASS